MSPGGPRDDRSTPPSDTGTASLADTGARTELSPHPEGDDTGEKLTHCMLALRVRARMEQGELLKDAFRAEMAGVRAVLENDG